MSFMLTKNGTLRTYLLIVHDTYYLKWLLVEQTKIIILLLFFNLFLERFTRFLFTLALFLYAFISFLNLNMQFNWVLQILALVNNRNEVSCFVILLNLLFSDYFRKVKRFIFKWTIALFSLDNFNQGQVSRKYFQLIIAKISFCPVLGTLDRKRMSVISLSFCVIVGDQLWNTNLTVGMSTHG